MHETPPPCDQSVNNNKHHSVPLNMASAPSCKWLNLSAWLVPCTHCILLSSTGMDCSPSEVKPSCRQQALETCNVFLYKTEMSHYIYCSQVQAHANQLTGFRRLKLTQSAMLSSDCSASGRAGRQTCSGDCGLREYITSETHLSWFKVWTSMRVD